MKCSYVKYTIIEIVPFEIKSHKTPLYTIVNSILLWTWLILYFFYDLFVSAKKKISLKKKYIDRKYTQTKPHNETVKPFSSEGSVSEIEALDIKLTNLEGKTEEAELDHVETIIFKRKYAKRILKALLSEFEDSEITMINFNREDFKKIGSFILRKDKVFIETQNPELYCDKIILVRAISKPVQMFLDFMLKKIF